MKKRIFLLSFMIFSQPTMGKYPFCGYYFNANIGMIQPELTHHYSLQIQGVDATLFNYQTQAKLTDSAILGSIAFGFSRVIFPENLVSLELRASFHDSEPKNTLTLHENVLARHVNFTSSVKFKETYSLLVKMGTVINEKTLLFLILGPQWSEISVSTNTNFTQSELGTVVSSAFQNSTSKNRVGILLGLGAEQMVTSHISVGLEYNYSDYRSFQLSNTMVPALLQNGIFLNQTSASEMLDLDLMAQTAFIKFTYYY